MSDRVARWDSRAIPTLLFSFLLSVLPGEFPGGVWPRWPRAEEQEGDVATMAAAGSGAGLVAGALPGMHGVGPRRARFCGPVSLAISL